MVQRAPISVTAHTSETKNHQISRNTSKQSEDSVFGNDLQNRIPQTTRIWMNNINGINNFPQEDSIQHLLNIIKETDTDILLIIEHNTH